MHGETVKFTLLLIYLHVCRLHHQISKSDFQLCYLAIGPVVRPYGTTLLPSDGYL